jgi:hypothetical protein
MRPFQNDIKSVPLGKPPRRGACGRVAALERIGLAQLTHYLLDYTFFLLPALPNLSQAHPTKTKTSLRLSLPPKQFTCLPPSFFLRAELLLNYPP